MTEVLKGVRVVELGTMITAPLTGMMLADLGADVIKVERPDGGDPFRSFRGGLYSPHFIAFNRNKRSVDARSAIGSRKGIAARTVARGRCAARQLSVRRDGSPRLFGEVYSVPNIRN